MGSILGHAMNEGSCHAPQKKVGPAKGRRHFRDVWDVAGMRTGPMCAWGGGGGVGSPPPPPGPPPLKGALQEVLQTRVCPRCLLYHNSPLPFAFLEVGDDQ